MSGKASKGVGGFVVATGGGKEKLGGGIDMLEIMGDAVVTAGPAAADIETFEMAGRWDALAETVAPTAGTMPNGISEST